MYRKVTIFIMMLLLPLVGNAQFNTDRLVTIGRSALYYEDYVLSIQYFNQAIQAKPYLYEPWFYRGVAKYYLDDFVGAEKDCTEAIERNPYVVSIYELRGISRIRQEKYADAIDDYTQALKYDPENRGLWHNRVLCRIQSKEYDAALVELDTIVARWSNYAPGYAMQAEVYMEQGDTAKAIVALEKSLDVDPYDGSTWTMRSMISLSKKEWKEAEGFLDKAIHLLPRNAGNYINRALARVNQNNLRGAMSDYDTALDIDPDNFLGHYNRGLLRSQVGDDNRAITDFDFVLKLEPDNLMALFNRALLLDKTGDLRGAIRDYSKVIEQYPNFWTGLHYRADCYRRLGMVKQAEEDEFRIYKARLYKSLYGIQPRLNKEQLRKRSDEDMDKYNQLVVADEQEVEHKYENDYRGRVQDHKVEMAFLPMFGLAFEGYHSDVVLYVAYDRLVDAFNQTSGMTRKIYINCNSAALDEAHSKDLFAYIDSLSFTLESIPSTSQVQPALLMRAIAYSATQNYESAMEDLTAYLRIDTTSALAYWQRAVCQFKANQFNASIGTDVAIRDASVLSDLNKAVQLNPQCAYIYYNMGNVHAQRKDYKSAVECYTKALSFDKNLAEAYYNRGLAKLFNEQTTAGISDLSKAGELGLYKAYSIIKRYGSRK